MSCTSSNMVPYYSSRCTNSTENSRISTSTLAKKEPLAPINFFRRFCFDVLQRTMVLNLGLVLEKFSGRSIVPEYSWKFEIRAGSNRLYGRFDPVLQNSGFLVHSKFSDFREAVPVLNLLPVPVYPGYGCVPPGWTKFLQNSCLGSKIECTCAGQDPRYRIQTLWRTVPSTDEVPILPQKGTDFAESSEIPGVIKL